MSHWAIWVRAGKIAEIRAALCWPPGQKRLAMKRELQLRAYYEMAFP